MRPVLLFDGWEPIRIKDISPCCTLKYFLLEFLTRVDAHAKQEFVLRPVWHCELFFHGLHQMERHSTDFSRVIVAVPDWQTWDHHVGVTYRLHLQR